MKKLLATLSLAIACSTAAFAQNKLDAVAKFQTQSVQMGVLQQGNPGTATFVVTNTGKQPLIIENATASCGCTKPEYTLTPIAPGKTGFVKATYNAASPGHFDKSVTVKFKDIDEVMTLAISGDVSTTKPVITN